jgi:hypothetical protein
MAITINGNGTIGGITAGGLPDGTVDTDMLAANAVTEAKLGSDEQKGLAKAWVNFDGTGTVAIRESYNVSSITDNSTGHYTVNFTTAMPDTNFAALSTCNYRTTMQTDQTARTTSSVTVSASIGASGSSLISHTDKSIVAVAVFR